MKKLLALLAGLALIAVAQPADADEIVASVNGSVVVGAGSCNTNEARFGGDPLNNTNAAGDPGEDGQLNKFGDVVILGMFQTGDAIYSGPLGVGDVDACSVPRIPAADPDPIPDGVVQSDGFLTGTTFGTGTGDVGVNLATGDFVCLKGTLLKGGAFASTLAQATATIEATWSLHPANPVTLTCNNHPPTVIDSGTAELQARVVAVPNGEFGIGENRVSGQVTSH